MNWRNSGEKKNEVFRRMTADQTPQSSFSSSIIYPEGNTEKKFFFADYPLLMTSLKQNCAVVTWQYGRVPTRDTTFHLRLTFQYLAFQTQVFNTLYHVNEKCSTRDI